MQEPAPRSRRDLARWLPVALLALTGVVAVALHPRAARGDLRAGAMVCAAAAASTAVALLARSHARRVWVGLALAAVVGHTNVLTFRGAGLYAHDHDIAHYYLGTRFYEELGYAGLYDALALADRELGGGGAPLERVRNLRSYDLEPAFAAVARGEELRASFTDARWEAFVADAGVFRRRLGPRWRHVFLDKGFNATPTWVVFGSPLAALVPHGSELGITALSLVDPLLLGAAALGVGHAVGARTALLAIAALGVAHGATFDWVGGAFLRSGYLVCSLGAAAALARRRHRAAGVLVGVAALLRVFPAALAVPLGLKALALWRERAVVPRRHVQFLAAFAATAAVGLIATGGLPRGFFHLREWAEHMADHGRNLSGNRIGLGELLTLQPLDRRVTWTEFLDLLAERERTLRLVALAAAGPALLVVALAARRATDRAATALGLVLVWAGTVVAAYYYALAALLAVARPGARGALALWFGGQAALHLAAPHVADGRHLHAAAGLLAVAATLVAFRRELLRSLRPRGLERPFRAPAPR